MLMFILKVFQPQLFSFITNNSKLFFIKFKYLDLIIIKVPYKSFICFNKSILIFSWQSSAKLIKIYKLIYNIKIL